MLPRLGWLAWFTAAAMPAPKPRHAPNTVSERKILRMAITLMAGREVPGQALE